MNPKELLALAAKARENSYAPYSGFRVGAALLAYTPTNCAERTAFFKAISEGEREFVFIAIVGGKNGISEPAYPCGVCRQVMAEFCDPDSFIIYVADGDGYRMHTLSELLKFCFTPSSLK